MATAFEDATSKWLDDHRSRRSGSRLERIARGLGHAERLFLRNVWHPLRGDFEHLHPEYEVLDWRGRPYYADFAWLPGYASLLFEIKGYGPHVRDMDRQKYCNELNRETFLLTVGYRVVSLSYDDVEQRPELSRSMIRLVLGNYDPARAPASRALLAEKEIIRLAFRKAEPIRPVDVVRHFEIDAKTATKMLRQLCEKGWLRPCPRGRGERNVRYELTRGAMEYFL
ncbi:hypothetical protein FE782_30730 [Paenibacillus antri]|uniref:DUF559 domain-containing protein n=1 Tax=Paenibacillus antri TaxID=2582848 RepID=A0A5R9G4E7_9BACL|nr:hypothetical protein [Paenibacillus antri]TLS48388.1 hypothetical protein FE782_30730 [Paenibacillus antri]